MSIDRGMDKEDVEHIYNRILLRPKPTNKHKIVPFAEIWMDLETVIQNEVRKRRPNIVYYIYIYMWNLGKRYR